MWIIIDEFLTEGAHEYSQIFNFYPDKKPTVDGLKAFIKGENSNLFMYWIDKNLNLNLKNSIFSTEYNKINSNFQLVSSIKSNKSKTLFTVISSKELSIQEASVLRGDGSFVPSYEAQAIEITLTPNNKIIVFNSMIDINNQKKSYLIDNILLYGKTGFIKKYNDTISFEIIKY